MAKLQKKIPSYKWLATLLAKVEGTTLCVGTGQWAILATVIRSVSSTVHIGIYKVVYHMSSVLSQPQALTGCRSYCR